MPSRWTCLLILLAWVVSSVWLFWTEVWPTFLPQEPPPYTIDLTNEAQRRRPKLRWYVFQNNNPEPTKFLAQTWVEYRETDDTFGLHSKFRPNLTEDRLDLGILQLHSMDTEYRVNRAGELIEVHAEYVFDIASLGKQVRGCRVELHGEIRDRQFYSSFRLEAGSLMEERKLNPVAVSRSGSMLMPLHPVNRIKGLKPGQSWRMPLVNPFADALGQLVSFGGQSRRVVTARVLDETKPFPTEPKIQCFVIEYKDDDVTYRTWVDADGGEVLRQEGSIFNTRIILQRDHLRYKPR